MKCSFFVQTHDQAIASSYFGGDNSNSNDNFHRWLWYNCSHSVTCLLLFGQKQGLSANLIRGVVFNRRTKRWIVNRLSILKCSDQRDAEISARRLSVRQSGPKGLHFGWYWDHSAWRMSGYFFCAYAPSFATVIPRPESIQSEPIFGQQYSFRWILLPLVGFGSANVCRNELCFEWNENFFVQTYNWIRAIDGQQLWGMSEAKWHSVHCFQPFNSWNTQRAICSFCPNRCRFGSNIALKWSVISIIGTWMAKFKIPLTKIWEY